MEASMYARIAAAVALFATAVPALAEPMSANEARRFVIGKLFSYTCFEGTRGAGRILSDGSVAGSIQLRGKGRVHHVRLPPNTLRVKGDSVCASVKGLPFEPCFNLDKTSHASFRGSIYGFSFAYCEFNRRGRRIDVARSKPSPKPSSPPTDLKLRAAIDGQR
jgi:hypothetical protein